jgi:hypothetical protein
MKRFFIVKTEMLNNLKEFPIKAAIIAKLDFQEVGI